MNSNPVLTPQYISESFGWNVLSNARKLCREGLVLDCGFDISGTKIVGRVLDQHRQAPYRVEVSLQREGLGKKHLSGVCTCPVKVNCVHAAAVALMIAEDSSEGSTIQLLSDEDEPDVIPQDGSGLVGAWLSSLMQLSNHSDCHERIIYILNLDTKFANAKLSVEPQIATRRKSSEQPATRPYNWHQLVGSKARLVHEEDRTIAKIWVACGTQSGSALLPPEDPDVLDLLLHRIISTGRAYWLNNLHSPLKLACAREGNIEWIVHSDARQSPKVVLNEPNAALEILDSDRPWFIDKSASECGPINLPFPREIVKIFRQSPRVNPGEAVVICESLKQLDQTLPLPRLDVVQVVRTDAPIPCLHLKYENFKTSVMVQEGAVAKVVNEANLAVLSFDYGFDSSKLSESWQVFQWLDKDNQSIVTKRDKMFEDEVRNRISQLGLQQSGSVRLPRTQSGFVMREHGKESWIRLMTEAVPALEQEGWQITTADSFQCQVVEGSGDWLVEIDGDAGWWFSLDLGINVDGQRIPLLPVLTQALKEASVSSLACVDSLNKYGKFYAPLADGRLIALPFERIKTILACLIETLDKTALSSKLDISIPQVMALLESDQAASINWCGAQSLKALASQLSDFDISKPIDAPIGLKASLRPYQMEGLRWLDFIATLGLGGILADGMGLGKTVQTLAHIIREKELGRLERPCLVLCPTSVLPNWRAEAHRLAPGLATRFIYGSSRSSLYEQLNGIDLVVTTYPLLVRDISTLMSLKWHAVILDEAQAIKNSDTKVAQAVTQLTCKYRLSLTGTPIENHLGELWAQFQFLMPGLLGSRSAFDRAFRTPIEKEGNTERLKILSSRIQRFLLRRTKEQVGKDLPVKTEIVVPVELEGKQRDLYETLRLSMHEQVLSEVKKRGLASSQLIILDALMKLRQTCCDPRLVKMAAAAEITESAKLDCLMEMLHGLLEDDRRVLLFSQFTSMLDLIAAKLNEEGLDYLQLRGDTKDREMPVKRFQNLEVPIFLISLKAGGTGLNLTAADTVIHYDPWWNPAVEDQATDRAHRIGQEKPVFVYRLVTVGTIEQRMLELQENKRTLSNSILSATGEIESALARFTESDLAALFAPLQS